MKNIGVFLLFLMVFLSPLDAFSQSDVFAVARTGTVEQIKALAMSNPDVINTVNDDGNSPLIIACYKGNYEVAAYLIQNVKNINYASGMGTALMAATVKNDLQLVKLLLENKANPDVTDANGTTALHYSATFRFYDIASLLVQYNANTELTDIRKKTAFDYAVIANDDKLIQILKSK
jgi:ankyrin repeat protein